MTSGSEKELLTNEYADVELPDGNYYPEGVINDADDGEDEDDDDDDDNDDDDEEEYDEDEEGVSVEHVEIEFVASSAAEVAEFLARIQR